MPGTYVLLVALPRPITVEVGALGAREFDAGWYAYVGSALGSGGFARVARHRRSAAGETGEHWHVDSLLAPPESRLDAVVAAPVAAECAVAEALPDGPVPGFGASDCGCRSHLAYAPERGPLFDVACAALRAGDPLA
jgi:endonuclease-3